MLSKIPVACSFFTQVRRRPSPHVGSFQIPGLGELAVTSYIYSWFHIVRYVSKFTYKSFVHINISMSGIERLMASFTPLEELSPALSDEEFEKTISRIRDEWWAVAAAVRDFLTF